MLCFGLYYWKGINDMVMGIKFQMIDKLDNCYMKVGFYEKYGFFVQEFYNGDLFYIFCC